MITVRSVRQEIVVLERAEMPPPSSHVLRHIEDLWNGERQRRGSTLTNGCLFSVESVTETGMTVWPAQYKWWIAQRSDPSLRAILNLRPLAVTGVTWVSDEVVLARRARYTIQHADAWELAPSGSVSHECRNKDGMVVCEYQILSELGDELNVSPSDLAQAPKPIAVMENDADDVVDIVYDLRFRFGAQDLYNRFAVRSNDEYTEIRVVDRAAIASFAIDRCCKVSSEAQALLSFLDRQPASR